MSKNAISIFVADDEREFIDGQIAAGKFASDEEILRAGITALERNEKIRVLRELIAEGDADVARGDVMSFDTSEDFLEYIRGDADELREKLKSAEARGTSSQQIPDTMNSVKARRGSG